MNAVELRTSLSLALIYLFRMLGLFMVLPVLAIAAKTFPDFSPVMLGFAIGGYGLMQAILQIPMGMLSDRYGRKPIIFCGLLVFIAGSLIAAQAESLLVLTIGRCLQGGGAIASAIMALAADVSRDKTRPMVMAVIGISIGLSFYLAVLIGPIITGVYGLSGIFWLTAAGALLSIPVLFFVVPSADKTLASQEVTPKREGLIRLVTMSQLWRLHVSVFLLHVAITLLFVPLPNILVDLGVELSGHWRIYLPVLLASIIGLTGLMIVSRKGNEKASMLLAPFFMLAGLALLLSESITLSVCISAGILFFSGFNYLEATLPSLVARISPAGEKGSAMGVYASFQFAGAFAGGATAGALLSITSAQHVFLAGILLIAVLFWVLSYIQKPDKVRRISLSASQISSQPDSVLQDILSLHGVVDARWSSQNDVLHLKIADDFDHVEAVRILNPS